MHLEPDAVPEAVAEVLAEAGGLDHVARRLVGIHAGDAGPRRLEPGELRLESWRRRRPSSSSGSGPVANVRVQSAL